MAPQVGAAIPELQGLASDREPVTVTLATGSRHTILFVFSTECPLCNANWPFWEAVARQVDTNRFRLVYLNTANSMSEDYTQSHYFHPSADILGSIDPQNIEDYSFRLTPIVLLIDSTATIRTVWLGVTRDGSRREMESALGVSLDGITLVSGEPG